MANPNQKTMINIANSLIEDNHNLVNLMEKAQDQLEDEANVQRVQSFAEQHQAFIKELSAYVRNQAAEPVQDGSLGGLFDQALVQFKGLTSSTDGDVLAHVAKMSEEMLTQYSDALGESPLNSDIHQIIRAHTSYLRISTEKLKGYSAAYSS